ALFAGSLLTAAMILYAARIGVEILRSWDLASGSEAQLVLERKTYLVSTILTWLFAFQLLSFFLFVYTADGLCHLFVGAMCAAGTLHVNGFGYPTLALKILTFLLAGTWMLLNHLDRQGRDYPLVRVKYALLLAMAPLLLAEVWLQGSYFLALTPDVITSCCGSLFGTEARTLSSQLAALPPGAMRVAFFLAEGLVIASGLYYLGAGRGGYGFAALAGAAFVVGLLSVISFIGLYVYQLPSHHCPFCVLKAEYGRVGYPLYGLILFGGLAGMGTGLLSLFRGIPSLRAAAPGVLRGLAGAAVACHLLLTAGVALLILTSDMRLVP
ncbi:MAG: hypothetical protein P1P84_13940, partial [Deferrisomatales bacterium]|nr:hypothetical protein [Deferrisomatales bacterium]